MGILVTFILVLLLCIAAFKHSPIVVCLYLLFAVKETTGVGVVFAQYSRIPTISLLIALVLAMCCEYYKLWLRKDDSLSSRRIFHISSISLGIATWIALAVYSGGSSIYDSFLTIVNSGIFGVVFALAYHRNRFALLLIVIAVSAQLLLSFAIIYFPKGPWIVTANELFTESANRLDISYGISSEGIRKTEAQFNNTIPFAFYGAVSFIAGVYLLCHFETMKLRLVGVMLIALGGWASFITVQRGIWAGILVGVSVLITPLTKKGSVKIIFFTSFLFLLGLIPFVISTESIIARNISGHFLEMRHEKYRFEVAWNAVDVLLEKPIFGVAGDVLESVRLTGGAPHQSFYFFAVMYGIPAGLLTLVITWLATSSILYKSAASLNHEFTKRQFHLAVALGWITISMAITNNMSAGILGWACLGFGCLPWAYCKPRNAF